MQGNFVTTLHPVLRSCWMLLACAFSLRLFNLSNQLVLITIPRVTWIEDFDVTSLSIGQSWDIIFSIVTLSLDIDFCKFFLVYNWPLFSLDVFIDWVAIIKVRVFRLG